MDCAWYSPAGKRQASYPDVGPPGTHAQAGPIRRLHLTEAQHRRLVQGRLGLVRGGAGYELVSADAAEKIGARAQERMLVLNAGEKEAPDPDDPYARYEVPDDLNW